MKKIAEKDKNIIFSITQPSVMKYEGDIEIAKDQYGNSQATLLALFGWYIIILMALDSTAVMVSTITVV